MTGRTRAPRGGLNRATIVRAALELMRAEGLDAVTVRAVAARLDVRPMALYTHVPSKDDLLAGVFEELLGEIELPDPATAGLPGLRALMVRLFHLLVANPELTKVSMGRQSSADREMMFSETVFAILLSAGTSRREAVGTAATLMRYTLGSAVMYPYGQQFDEDPQHWPKLRATLTELPADRYPAMHSLADDLPEFTQQQAFEYGLDLILDRVEP
ncbi:TetR/AcrR family transcriptional regulator C-terminal domain-containing protein [Kutzneria viridogrisea]|uniref:HTH tetR-type domain-containing protein n=2 Tax=Kutzneria TaxID=43356 RepID=W5W4I9_9PSEU|nr:TetR/AcrR family transcriptional regulator C-terminal domain-containing protein [Kutzneria albida]AHH95680.1 hypothetical protein KALB_2312 [Kutzneria albida DSM 43870]MBA8926955.1 AcrR family transcriptional regulator [Kutzneria viridogrisea]